MTAVFVNAQVSYSISPSRTLAFTAVLNQLNASTIYQLNTGPAKIVLKWERISVTIPNGWTASICDNISCFGDIPASSTMDSVGVNEKGFLIMDIDPGTVIGSGVIKMYVYQDGYYNQGDTLTWNITSSAVGIEDFSETNVIIAYPNPVTSLLHIDLKNSDGDTNSGYIMDVLGKEVMHFSLLPQINVIDIANLNKGCYSLIVESGKRKWLKRIVKE